MSKPDIQYFAEDGTWVKPPGAIRADVVLQAAGGGSSTVTADGLQGPVFVRGGKDGQIKVQSIPASQLPDLVSVEIGKGGRPGGRDGYVLVVTHLDNGRAAAMSAQPADDRTPWQIDRDRAERTGNWPESWGPYHRHFASDAIHRDGGSECDQPGTPRRVYVFDADALSEHEAAVAEWAVKRTLDAEQEGQR